MRKTIQRIAMVAYQPHALGVALLEDPLDFVVDDLRRRLAVRPRTSEAAERIAAQEPVVARCQRSPRGAFRSRPSA